MTATLHLAQTTAVETTAARPAPTDIIVNPTALRPTPPPLQAAASRFRAVGYQTVVAEGMLYIHIPGDGWLDITEWVEADLVDMYLGALLDTDGIYIDMSEPSLYSIDTPTHTHTHTKDYSFAECYMCGEICIAVNFPQLPAGVPLTAGMIADGYMLLTASYLSRQWVGPLCLVCQSTLG